MSSGGQRGTQGPVRLGVLPVLFERSERVTGRSLKDRAGNGAGGYSRDAGGGNGGGGGGG